MTSMDVFNADAFSAMQLTSAIQTVDYRPQMLGSMGLFVPKPVRTELVAVEEWEGALSIIQTSPRGAPPEQQSRDNRKIRDFRTVRIAKSDRINASEIQGIRAFGSETELMQVQDEVARRLAGPTGLRAKVELTHENMRLGAVQGIVLDADGSTIYNYFTEFGVSQPAEIDFDLDNASPASGAVRQKCNQVVRAVHRGLKGLGNAQTRVIGLAGDDFWDGLTTHSEVIATYTGWQAAADLRSASVWEAFSYGGIDWINYRGTDDNSTVAVPTDKAKFFPANAPGAFEVAWSPAESFPFVNTPGEPIYSWTVPDRERQMWVDLEVYSYPLFLCARPGALQRAKRT